MLHHQWTDRTTRKALHHSLSCTPIVHSNWRRNRQHDSLSIHRWCEEVDYSLAKTHSMAHPTNHWISIEARDTPIHPLETMMDELHPVSSQYNHSRASSIHSLHWIVVEWVESQTDDLNQLCTWYEWLCLWVKYSHFHKCVQVKFMCYSLFSWISFYQCIHWC